MGTVYCAGFLPALAYARSALVARNDLAKSTADAFQDTPAPDPSSVATDTDLLRRSYNPWRYPPGIRSLLTAPAYEAKIDPPITCSVPMVDAVFMECDKGILIPLANYTLQPLKEVMLTVRTGKPVRSVESAHEGKIPFRDVSGDGERAVRFSLPLKETDFVKILWGD